MATRNVRPFVHLRVLSSYSLGRGLSSPGDICRHARRIGFDAVALTDVSGTFGFAEFHRAAREVGVKPIYGTLLFLDWNNPPHTQDPIQSVILLALDRTGLRNVCEAATRSATRRERGEGLYLEDIEAHGEGVVAVAGVDLDQPEAGANLAILAMRDVFGDRLFAECRDGLTGERAAVQSARLATLRDEGVAPVLVQDVRFVGPVRPRPAGLLVAGEDASYAQRVFGDPRAGGGGPEHGMRTAAEMSGAFESLPEAHSNAALIAALVHPDLLESVHQVAEPSSESSIFEADARADALLLRIETALRAREAQGAGVADLRERTHAELARIERAGIGDRFLEYGEILRRLRAADVAIGPATGLSLQSCCAWLLGITAFDPYTLDERFDPEFEARARATHILDLQIAPGQRPRVLAILNQVYDTASIGYVPSVEHITAARALRIASRLSALPEAELDKALRVAARTPGATLRELSEDDRPLGKLCRHSALLRDLVANAAAIEGLPFGFTRSKRTIAVSQHSLRAMFGYMVNAQTGEHFIQSTRESFPLGGIRRIDIDALHALDWVGRDGNWGTGETEAYRLIERGDLEGIYLLEARAGAVATRFGIAGFSDLVLFVTLLRHRTFAGAMAERVDSFRGERADIPAAALLGDIVAATNGWVLYTDQARDLLARLTGLSVVDAARMLARFADHSPGNLAALRREFLKQTVEVPVAMEDAVAWFGRLLRLAGSVQDRQRVLAECLIVHRSLVAKSAGRTRFMANVLDHAAGGEKRRRYRDRLKARHKWLPADINRSGRRHSVEHGKIRAPLWDVNGVTREAADAIIRMRGSRRYSSIDEFRGAAREAGVNADAVDALVRSGAFDAVEDSRAVAPTEDLPPAPVLSHTTQLAMDFAAGLPPASPRADETGRVSTEIVVDDGTGGPAKTD